MNRNDDKKTFPGLEVLKSCLDAQHQFRVLHERGHCWKAQFIWHDGATGEAIQNVETELGVSLPLMYRSFLSEHNGCTLFKDPEYGQWGLVFFSTHDLVQKQRYWGEIHLTKFAPRYLVFAESLGDADILLMDLARPTQDGRDCAVIDGNCDDFHGAWPTISRSFHEWLDHLIVAQGTKYWRWF